MKKIPDATKIASGIVSISPPDHIIDGGVFQIPTIGPNDVDIEKQIKPLGTCIGKRYVRPVLTLNFK